MTQADLIARLRRRAETFTGIPSREMLLEAADLIERLSPPLDPLHDALMSSVKVRKVLSPPLDGEGVKKLRMIADLTDYPDSRSVRGACLLGEYDITFGDIRAALATISTPREEEVERVAKLIDESVGKLCDLHRKMVDAVRKDRPYPVSIRLGQSDTDAVLNGAVALEHAKAALASMAR